MNGDFPTAVLKQKYLITLQTYTMVNLDNVTK